ncbi:aldose epimerase family protein [Paracoccaceae bacterium Fryx2]|nr:aldose epimerase family protein [Paracoccaceae bacterium Fryx2]
MQAAPTRVAPFGSAHGQTVQRILLQAGDLTVALLTWGAVLQSVRLAGVAHDLTLGSDRIDDYLGAMRHHGSVIGPVANRISGAQARIAGRLHRFEANQAGTITLHGGDAGTHLKLWSLVAATADSATLGLTLPDGDGGFPGNRTLAARFEVAPPATLRLTVTATTDAATLINVANHSYWNLDGSADWSGHALRIAADRYLPTTPDFTPTGEIFPTEGTPHDFRTAREITPGAPPLDHCFCLSDARRPLTPVLWLTGRGGTSLTLATTEPGVQVYDGRAALRPGHGPYEGLAIEAQFWPDAPNHPAFPAITLTPGTPWEQVTEWHFAHNPRVQTAPPA